MVQFEYLARYLFFSFFIRQIASRAFKSFALSALPSDCCPKEKRKGETTWEKNPCLSTLKQAKAQKSSGKKTFFWSFFPPSARRNLRCSQINKGFPLMSGGRGDGGVFDFRGGGSRVSCPPNPFSLLKVYRGNLATGREFPLKKRRNGKVKCFRLKKSFEKAIQHTILYLDLA